jgi:ATP-dependent helicase/nuclease subunit B
MTFLDEPAPRWFTIPSQRPFLVDLAKGLASVLAPLEPQAAAGALILLPTRRACRELAGAFVEASPGAAALLPRIRALGDLDEGEPPFEPGEAALDLPPAISPSRRRFELAAMVAQHEALLERQTLDAGGALELADALAGFLDACQMEEVGDPDLIDGLVEGELARHWRISADFLKVALVAWPARLAVLGLMDVMARRTALLRHLAAAWTRSPPAGLVIAAGSTGAAPAAADLLAVVGDLPRGCVILPGLDRSLADNAWEEVEDQHPQGGLKRLLARAGIDRENVRDWGAAEALSAGRWRRRLISEALRPADQTADWREVIETIRQEGAAAGIDPIARGLEGLYVTAAGSEEEAASLAAVLLREALETPGQTCALVTPDAALGRRVSARLERWNITADSSAGAPLAGFPAAVLASLVARILADPTDPVTLLAILKHPFTRLGRRLAELDPPRRTLERHGLRGPRPASWRALAAALEAQLAKARDGERANEGRRAADLEGALELLPAIRGALAPGETAWAAGDTAPAAQAATGLAMVMEALALRPGGGLGDLWGGPAGEGVAALIASLIGESEGLPPLTRAGFSSLVDALLARELVREGAAGHPRLKILGVLEGRLLAADRLILAGLEEGVWPRAAPLDPFLSRPMRDRLGLPPPERRIGLSAHDFAQAAAAPQVVLIHSRRRAGPAVESRWLWRLRVLAAGANVELPTRDDALQWARALDAPIEAPPAALAPAARPRPTPKVSDRPRKMSVTGVELWLRDPYAIYARDILKLRPLDPPDASVDALARGTAVHRAIEAFTKRWPGDLPPAAEVELERLLAAALEEEGVHPARMAREGALARNLAPWLVAFERGHRQGATLHVEATGELAFEAPGGAFTLTARADRLAQRDDRVDVIDFKTGKPPSDKQVGSGLAPQLTLTGAILAAGGFAGVGPAIPGELIYVRLSGRRIPGEVKTPAKAHEGAEMAREALARLQGRVAWFDDPATAYPSWAIPQFMDRWGGDYDHLARVWEWHVMGDIDDDGAP